MGNNLARKIEIAHADVAPSRFVFSVDRKGVAAMKRDMGLLRRILVEIESRKDAEPCPVIFKDVDQAVLDRHVEMLCKIGFVEINGSIHNSGIGEPLHVTDMSWAGHDFLAILKDEGVWNKIQGAFSPDKLASMPLEVIRTVGVGLMTKFAMSAVGLN